MAKPIAAMVKLQVPAGQATPAPPVGTALGPHGVNIMEFVKQFNAKTAQAQGMITPVEVTIFKDRTFTFITKTPPAAVLLKKEAGIEKGSPTSNRQKAGKVTRGELKKIAEIKLSDLSAAPRDCQRQLGRVGELLGPRWLMPRCRAGTVTIDAAGAVKEVKAGKIELRLDQSGIVPPAVRNKSFSAEQLQHRLRTFLP